MKIKTISLHEDFKIEEPIAACIGYFDGLHKGHQKLVEKAQMLAQEKKIASAIITFLPDPLDVITGIKHKHIQNFDARLKIMEKMSLDYAIVFDFTKEMSELSPKAFYDQILAKLNLKALVCGFDYRYAHKGSGNFTQLQKDAEGSFEVYQIDEQLYLDEKISSTRIRQAIQSGDVQLAKALLGYNYFIEGVVVSGKRNGHLLNFPTANLKYSEEIVLPKPQVYTGFVQFKGEIYRAMINFGENPTVANDNPLSLEVHLFNFEGDLYNQELIVYFEDVLREEIKFKNFDELKTQLQKDAENVLNREDNGIFIF